MPKSWWVSPAFPLKFKPKPIKPAPDPLTEDSSALCMAYNCEPLMASVLFFSMRPAATLVMVRSASLSPTLTVATGVAPAKL